MGGGADVHATTTNRKRSIEMKVDSKVMQYRFEDPPPIGRNVAKTLLPDTWANRLAPLRKHPGRWAKLRGSFTPKSGHVSGTRLRKGAISGIEAGEFEITVRRTGENTAAMYVRYVGGPEQVEAQATNVPAEVPGEVGEPVSEPAPFTPQPPPPPLGEPSEHDRIYER